MKPETEGKIKYGVWGLICGAIIVMIIGFAWGGWTTAGTTKEMNEEAVLANQASICVAQFMQETNQAEQFQKFENENSWDRVEFIRKGGWDKMPGQKEADYGVARACSKGLELLIKK